MRRSLERSEIHEERKYPLKYVTVLFLLGSCTIFRDQHVAVCDTMEALRRTPALMRWWCTLDGAEVFASRGVDPCLVLFTLGTPRSSKPSTNTTAWNTFSIQVSVR